MPTENPENLIKTNSGRKYKSHFETDQINLYQNENYSPQINLLVNTNKAVALVTMVGSLVI
jgi:hypothetical protein